MSKRTKRRAAERAWNPVKPCKPKSTPTARNSQHSSGPASPEGKATVSQNRRSRGLTGSFQILPAEDMLELKVLTETVYAE